MTAQQAQASAVPGLPHSVLEDVFGLLTGTFVASLGIFAAGDGLARFQSVKTRTDFRNQGLAAALVVASSRWARAELDARTLVMAADPTYSAIRVYRAVGFTEGGTHLEATLAPEVRTSPPG